MKKLLKLLFTFSTATTLPLTVIACQSESLDGTLDIIRKDDELKFDLSNFDVKPDTKKETDGKTTISLTFEESEKIAKEIANQIIKKSEAKDLIPWFDDAEINAKCYNITIKNGEKNDNEKRISWNLPDDNKRFTFEVNYDVGTKKSEKEFTPQQQITKSFKIKYGTSASDEIVKKWIDEFNKKKYDIDNPIEIDLSQMSDITKPEDGKNWTDLDKKVRDKVNNTIQEKINGLDSKATSFSIENIGKVITDMKLELQLLGNLNDSEQKSDSFYIQFVLNK